MKILRVDKSPVKKKNMKKYVMNVENMITTNRNCKKKKQFYYFS